MLMVEQVTEGLFYVSITKTTTTTTTTSKTMNLLSLVLMNRSQEPCRVGGHVRGPGKAWRKLPGPPTRVQERVAVGTRLTAARRAAWKHRRGINLAFQVRGHAAKRLHFFRIVKGKKLLLKVCSSITTVTRLHKNQFPQKSAGVVWVFPAPQVQQPAIASAFPQATPSRTLPESDAPGGRTTGTHDAVSGQRGRPGCAHAPTGGRRLVPTPLGPKPRRFKGQR